MKRSASVLAFLLLAAGPRSAVAQDRSEASTGLLVVAHGADSGWNDRVREVVAAVQWDGPVRLAFLMGSEAETASWDAAVRSLEAASISRLVVVPLMVSSFGAHMRQVRHYAGEPIAFPAMLAGHAMPDRLRPTVPTIVTPALDDAPELGVILRDRWAMLPPVHRSAPLVLVAHGPNGEVDAQRWVERLRRATGALRDALGEDAVRIGLMRDDADLDVRNAAVALVRDTIAALAGRAADSVTVMTVLVSTSMIDQVRFPADLAGMPLRYVGAVLAPHPALALWIRRMATEAMREPTSAIPPSATPWP